MIEGDSKNMQAFSAGIVECTHIGKTWGSDQFKSNA